MSDFKPITDTEEMRRERPTPRLTDPEKMRAGLCRWFERRHPEAEDLSLSDFQIPEASGMSNITLLFDLSWREGGKRQLRSCVARVKPAGGVLVFEHYDMSLQYKAMQSVAGIVPVPKLLGLEMDPGVIGSEFYIMEKLDGRVPPDLPPMHMDGWVKQDATPAQREELWWNGIATMARMHEVDWHTHLDFLYDTARGGEIISRQFLYKMQRYLEWAPAPDMPVPEYRRALQWMHDNCDEKEDMGLCWGDARMGNTMFARDSSEVVALFDWEMTGLAHPVKDLAWWWTIDHCMSAALGVERLEGFPSEEESVHYWVRQSGCSASQFEFYKVATFYYFGLILLRTSMAANNPDPVGSNFVTPLLVSCLDELGVPPAA